MGSSWSWTSAAVGAGFSGSTQQEWRVVPSIRKAADTPRAQLRGPGAACQQQSGEAGPHSFLDSLEAGGRP